MKRTQHFDLGTLGKPRKQPNGTLIVDAFLTRTGVFEYQNLDGSRRRELRLAEEVFAPKSLSSLELTTLTMGHPTQPVTADNASSLSIGAVGNDVRREGDKMRATLAIHDGKAIDKMKRGTNQVSNGYWCDLQMTPGVTQGLDGIDDGLEYDCIQRNIEHNHSAIVRRGRAGSEVSARMDAFRADGVDVAVQALYFDEVPLHVPFEIRPSGTRFEVVNIDTGEVKGIHNAREDAERLLATLTAEEPDAQTRDKQDPTTLNGMSPTWAKRDNGTWLLGATIWMRAQELGITLTELATAAAVAENGMEFIFSGEVTPTGLQIERLAEVLDVSADDLKDLLPERQREQTDTKDDEMKFKLTIDGIEFEFEADGPAQQALVQKLSKDATSIDDLNTKLGAATAKTDTESARADAAEADAKAAKVKLDAADDPKALREAIEARMVLEHIGAAVMGEAFKADMSDEVIRASVIADAYPDIKLDGKSKDYATAMYDAALVAAKGKIEKADAATASLHRTRAAIVLVDDADTGVSESEKARLDSIERKKKMATQPLAVSKDRVADPVTVAGQG